MKKSKLFPILILSTAFYISACGKSLTSNILANEIENEQDANDSAPPAPDSNNDVVAEGCKTANQQQLAEVNFGLSKKDQFLSACVEQTQSEKWCAQVARPNPESYNVFKCTYSPSQPHFLVHPDEKTWENAIQGVKLVQLLESKGVKIELIYNWWRPEPYNVNVGGAAGRHPFGTSVDVRFINKAEQNKAFSMLCSYRKQGMLRALGYYAGTGLHLGIADKTANTWGRECP